MKNDVLVDTNVFIYAYDRSSPYHERCRKFLEDTSLNLFTTTKNISECIAVMTKLNYPGRDIQQLYTDIDQNLVTLFPSGESLKIFYRLFENYKPKGNRIFDLEVASIMIAFGITDIATINESDFVYIKEIKIFSF
ncbi:MAG: type II toxin-antitoxin system VapC family toxin [Bacteroidia bacterium]